MALQSLLEPLLQVAADRGHYWCSPCEVGCSTSAEMEEHLWGDDHREVEAAVNRSVAVVVSRRTALHCRAPRWGTTLLAMGLSHTF